MVQRESDQPDGEETSAGREARGGPEDRDGDAVARTVRLVASDYLVTVNPLDGSEIEPCPPGERPGPPGRRPVDDRPEVSSAPVLLERDEERERITRLLSRGRSVRLTGEHGSGRTALLDAVAAGVTTAAPDGVIRLSAYRHTPSDLLHALFSAVYDAPLHRPSPALLRETLAAVGAVVLVDDVEFGGAGLDEVLEATPECAYLLVTLPDAAPPSSDSHLEEVALGGLSRTGCLEVLERSADRALTDEEADWAADLWLAGEGHLRTIVQGGTLLRQRDAVGPAKRPALPRLSGTGSLGGGDAARTADRLIPRIADGLGETARSALRFAVALGGELPHRSHLPALTDDAHFDEALDELRATGLLTTVGGHLRLADGSAAPLAAAGLDDDDGRRAESAARHYAWWTGHRSVTGDRVREEADVVAAAVQSAQRAGHAATAVLLARTAAPLLAAGPRWGVWERVLRSGQESARVSGAIAEQAYFHHELGVLALCCGNLERARAELEASIGLRGALADRRGAVAGRRALALVSDRMAEASGAVAAFAQGLTDEPAAAATPERLRKPMDTPPVAAASPSEAPSVPTAEPEPYALLGEEAVTGRLPAVGPDGVETILSPRAVPASSASSASYASDDDGSSRPPRGLAARSTRRNVAAAGAGALLAAVLGTVITLGYASDGDDPPSDTVRPDHSTSEQDGDGGQSGDQPTPASDGDAGGSSQPPSPSATSTSEAPGLPGPTSTPSTSGSPTHPGHDGTSGGTSGGDDGGTSGSTDGGSDDGGSNGGTSSDGGSTEGGTNGGSDGGPTGTPSGTPTPSGTGTPSGTADGGGSGPDGSDTTNGETIGSVLPASPDGAPPAT